ncbi:hypothetical protein JHK82_033144 [Glycine max]|uniref:Uncharacterized protein n=1 Tax=Glycine max TaxID=3847 RepID=A0A0R0H3U1_SOYBN|nr:hypothetical protein JHK87_033081 [Glycine soja]KAG4979902.1 hypothetical protein JHK85_033860 [Glycine max]KAG4985544.1 hypothetical protein JHK86_033235 [Glycine max]KAG5118724.1 hypothetical protein JHK82_033144 [Glycine max]KAG5139714.1 hypothetical protein JHK84_033482 [Glycine max]
MNPLMVFLYSFDMACEILKQIILLSFFVFIVTKKIMGKRYTNLKYISSIVIYVRVQQEKLR